MAAHVFVRPSDWDAFARHFAPSLVCIQTTSDIHVDTMNLDFARRGIWFRERRNGTSLMCTVGEEGIGATRDTTVMRTHMKAAVSDVPMLAPVAYSHTVVTRFVFAGGMDAEVTDVSGKGVFATIRLPRAMDIHTTTTPVSDANPSMVDCMLTSMSGDDTAATDRFRRTCLQQAIANVAPPPSLNRTWPRSLEDLVRAHVPSQTNIRATSILDDANRMLSSSHAHARRVLDTTCAQLEALPPSPALDGLCYGAYTRLRDTVDRCLPHHHAIVRRLWDAVVALDGASRQEWSVITCTS